MSENRFSLAGWLSIVAAVVLPLAFILEGITEVALEIGDIDIPWGVGPADALFLFYAALAIYLLMEFKRLMFEYYSFREISTVINIAIFWHIIFYGGSFILETLFTTVWPQDDLGLPLFLLVFWIVGIAAAGIIDIVMGVILLRHRSRFNMPVKVFALLIIVTGFFEGTVVFSFLALLLAPASYVAMAFIFLRRPEEVEFV
ncbi:MAG: hypothetical protein JSU74_05500 [Candidatus Zixiibacteriota bacterium]|nr:MAG: hypothetical protein JSU74_05500 [candidate division Zixibacteria bacterium]